MGVTILGRRGRPAARPAAALATALRAPDVDSLCELQLRLRARLRRQPPGSPERERLGALVALTIKGIAAALRTTG